MIKKIWHIILGTFRNIFGVQTEFEKERLEICNCCEHRVQIGKNIYMCSQCGCIIKSKVKVEDEQCLLKKW